MKPCVIYLRVSTAAQADSGHGIEAQRTACLAYAVRHDLEVVAEHVDAGKSGRLDADKRPAFAAAQREAKERGAVLLAYSLSRLARSARMLADLAERLPIASATESFDTSTPAGRMMLGVLSTFAAFEADLIRERTKDGLAAAKASGVKLGRRPIPEALRVKVRALHAEGLTYRAIAERLNSEGVLSALGKQWHASTVCAALKGGTR